MCDHDGSNGDLFSPFAGSTLYQAGEDEIERLIKLHKGANRKAVKTDIAELFSALGTLKEILEGTFEGVAPTLIKPESNPGEPYLEIGLYRFIFVQTEGGLLDFVYLEKSDSK